MITSLTARVVVPVALLATVLTAAPASAASVPYTDPSVAGVLALCDASGHQLTSGSTLDLPLAATAVSSAAAPKGYSDPKAKATLYAYQPRQGVDPADWSGGQLTGSSFFSNPAHPMAAFTTGDKRLHEVLQIYPANWAGFVQLRLFFSEANKVAFTQTYPSANLQVNGSSWHQVDPPAVNCGAGRAVSIEKLLLPASRFPAPSKAPATSAVSGVAGTTTGGGGSTLSASGSGASVPADGGGSNTVLAGLLAAGLLAVGVGAAAVARGRRASR